MMEQVQLKTVAPVLFFQLIPLTPVIPNKLITVLMIDSNRAHYALKAIVYLGK